MMLRTPIAFAPLALVLSACSTLADTLPDPGAMFARRDATAVVLRPKPVKERPEAALRGLKEDAYLAAARAEALLIDERVIGPCSSDGRRVVDIAAESVKAVDRVLETLSLDDGRVIREAVTVAGCGLEPRRHIVYAKETSEGVAFESGVAGLSIAPLRAQQEAVKQVVTQAVGVVVADVDPEGCDGLANDPWVLDAVVTAKPKAGAWRERWTYVACGGRYALDMDFATVDGETLFETAINLGAPMTAE